MHRQYPFPYLKIPQQHDYRPPHDQSPIASSQLEQMESELERTKRDTVQITAEREIYEKKLQVLGLVMTEIDQENTALWMEDLRREKFIAELLEQTAELDESEAKQQALVMDMAEMAKSNKESQEFMQRNMS